MISEIRWHSAAQERLGKVPFFIRPFVKKKAETVARERGLAEVTTQLLDELKGADHAPE